MGPSIGRVSHIDILDAPAARQIFDHRGDMPNAQRKVMGRPGQTPVFDEAAQVGREFAACVGVAGWRDRAGQGFALGNHEFEAAIMRLGQADTGHRAMSKLEFDADTGADADVEAGC